MSTLFAPRAIVKEFLPQEFRITVWSRLKPYYNELLNRRIKEASSFDRWWTDFEEMRCAVQEEYQMRLLRAWQQATDKRIFDAFSYLALEVLPRAKHFEQLILAHSLKFAPSIHKSIQAQIPAIEQQLERYNEANIALEQEILVQVHSQLCKGIHNLNWESAIPSFQQIFDWRHQMAQQAGYTNYASYHFAQIESTPPTSRAQLHNWIQDVLSNNKGFLNREFNVAPITFKSKNAAEQLLNKSAACLSNIDPALGHYLRLILQAQRFDFKPKFNFFKVMPMPLSGIPHLLFYSNQKEAYPDALSYLSGLGLYAAFHPEQNQLGGPSVSAEFAAQSIRLMSSTHWEAFFSDKEQMLEAQSWQLQQFLKSLELALDIDRFEQALYSSESPDLEQLWGKAFKNIPVEKRLHVLLAIAERPFFSIRRLQAGLAALQLWQAYEQAPKAAAAQFIDHLSQQFLPANGLKDGSVFSKWAPSNNTIKKVATFVTEKTKTSKTD